MKCFKWQYLKLKGKKLWLLTMNQHETNSMYDHMLMNELHLIKWEHILNRDHQLLMAANIERKTFSLKVSLQILLIWKQINRICYKWDRVFSILKWPTEINYKIFLSVQNASFSLNNNNTYTQVTHSTEVVFEWKK